MGTCFLLYFLVGAIRWSARRPAVSDHARRHIGWLLAAVALVLAWGYWLEPYEMVAGIGGGLGSETTHLRVTISLALTGGAFSTALLSARWAVRPGHGWVAGGWAVLALASMLGHYVLPGLAGVPGRVALDDASMARLEGLSFGLADLDTMSAIRVQSTIPPGPLSLWTAEMI